MGCVVLTKSRKLGCVSAQPGIRAIGIGEYDAANLITTTVTGVTELPAIYDADTIARLELKNTTTKYLENGVSGGDSRSSGVTGNIICVFNVPAGADVETTTFVEQLLKGEVVLFVETKSGLIFVAGANNGAIAVTIDGDTGGTIGDLNGYTVTFQTMEPDFARKYVLTGDALTDYAAALMAY
ncbi:MAG: hypothetical protein ACOVJ8_09150 [Sediminibacterium sp.]|jgi:hypothetical protein